MWQVFMSWNVPLLAGLAGITIIFFLVKRLKRIKVGYVQTILLCSSVVLFYLLLGSPLKTLSHISFSTHMLQMAILFFFVPPLFLLGIPKGIYKKFNTYAKDKNLAIIPLTALIAFSTLFFFYHLPQTYKFLSQDGFTYLLLILAVVMWFPVIYADNSSRRKKYALLSGALLMPACLLFMVNGFMGESNVTPLLNQLTTELCISPSQMDALLPFRIHTGIDQFFGGFLMLALHKFSLMLTTHVSSALADGHSYTIKPSLQEME